MNHFYRSVWNEISRTYVAAAETVRGRGKGSKSSRSATGGEAESGAGPDLAGTTGDHARPTSRGGTGFGGLRSMALEQRFMFDGAAVDTAVDLLTLSDLSSVLADSPDTADKAIVSLDSDLVSLPAAMATAHDQIRQYLSSATDEQLFAQFNGGQAQPDAEWTQRLNDLRLALDTGSFSINVMEMDQASQFTAVAAYSSAGPNGERTIFVNRSWFEMFGAKDSNRILVEELGHAMDDYLNPQADTAGDEGESFAAAVVGSHSSEGFALGKETGQVVVDGVSYEVEFASFSFTNAYQMITDVDGDGVVDNTESWAEKEQESHVLRVAGTGTDVNKGGLGAVTINDDTNSSQFSGNDVSAIGINIGGTNYYGWISRPVKVQGSVVGFYFWTDQDFTNLSSAQLDGNQDNDTADAPSNPGVTDNKGFILVVDQSYFNGLINKTGGMTQVTVSASTAWSAVAAGTYNTIEVGSSSDRVDNALNALLPAPVAVAATADTSTSAGAVAGIEAGYNVTTVPATGNVLTNDTGSGIVVNQVTSSVTGIKGTVTSSAAAVIAGRYGTLTMNADGSYSYAITNSDATVNALLSNSLTEAFTYSIADGKGGSASSTLTVTIQGRNDVPAAVNDYNSAKESLTDGAGTTTYTGYNATGDVLANDTDVDAGDGKSISGTSVSGAATVASSTAVTSTPKLIFNVSSGFQAVGQGDALYVLVGGTYYAAYDSTGANRITLTANPVVSGGTTELSLSGTPGGYRSSATTFTSFGTSLTSYFQTNPGVRLYSDNNTIDYTTTQGKAATVSSTLPANYTTLTGLTGISGTIAVGMSVFNGLTDLGALVSDLTYTNGVLTGLKLDKPLTIAANASLSFTGTGGVGQVMHGAHGTLTLGATGTYTYTPDADNPLLATGQSAVEVFDYTMQDTAGVTSTAKLYITVHGASTSDPGVSAATATATETGVSAGVNPSGTLTTTNWGTGGKVSAVSLPGGAATTFTTSTIINGTYGVLTISETGSYSYAVTNSNSTVDALRLASNQLTDTFNYKVTNQAGGVSWSTLTVTINGANDAPVAVADTHSVAADGSNATGSVLTNDTDVDAGDTKVVSQAGTTAANTAVSSNTTSATGLGITGSYGTLTIGADGTYKYVVDTNNSSVKALLPASTPLTDTFRYEVKDTAGATSSNTLTISITGVNEAPTNTYPSSVSTLVGTAIAFTGTNQISVADVDNNLSKVILHVDKGTLSTTGSGGSFVFDSSTGNATLTGTQQEINNLLASLRYLPNNGFAGTDFLTIFSQDGLNAYDSDGIAINIPTNTQATVVEAGLSSGSNSSSNGENYSGTLTLAAGQTVTAQQTGSILDGSSNPIGTWQVNTDGSFNVTLTAGSSATSSSFSYIVRDRFSNAVNNTVSVTISDDGPTTQPDTGTVNEGSTLTGNVLTDGTDDAFGADGPKTTSPVGGVVGVRLAGGDNTTAVTAGAGTEIAGTHGKLTLNANGSYSYVANTVTTNSTETFVYTIEDADGTRSTTTLTITVSDVPGNTPVTVGAFSVADVTVSEGGLMTFTVTRTGTSAVSQTVAYTTSANGTAATTDFTAASGTLTFAAGVTSQTFTVQTTPDTPYEGPETFGITLSSPTGGATISSATATGTIRDDGTAPDPDGSGPLTPDDDRGITVLGKNDVSEGSQAVFAVTLQANQAETEITLVLGAAGDSTEAADYSPTLTAYYHVNGIRTELPIKDGKIRLPAGITTFHVSVPTTVDADYEGAESFTLSATVTGGRSGSDDATIRDDGSGKIYGETGIDSGAPADDDRAIRIEDVTINEISPYAVFRVEASGGQQFVLSLRDGPDRDDLSIGTATAGADYRNSLETYDGVKWVAYEPGSLVSVPASGSVLLVRVPVIDDSEYEGAHAFTLVATIPGTVSITGNGIIGDYGTGAIFNDSGAEDRLAPKNDDRGIKIDSPIVNEGSEFVVFTIQGVAGPISLRMPATYDTDEPIATGVDKATSNLQFWENGRWQTYDGSNASIPAEGVLLVRVSIVGEHDTLREGSEHFALVATRGEVSSVGEASVRDDGTGVICLFGPDSAFSGTTTLGVDDDFDKDGITPTTEEALATLAASQGIGNAIKGDLNGDGKQDAEQNALATLAWTVKDYFVQGNAGTLTESKAIISVSVTGTGSSKAVSETSQLLDINVATYDEVDPATELVVEPDGSRTVTLADGSRAATPWDPIRFAIAGVDTDRDGQPDLGLTDISDRAGTQVRILIDIRASGLGIDQVNSYIKYVSQEAIDAAGELVDLDGQVITRAGWYDFTQREPGGDGARFIDENGDGLLDYIELIITDNAFGDNDAALDQIFDPGTPVLITAPEPVSRNVTVEPAVYLPPAGSIEFGPAAHLEYSPFDSTLYALAAAADPKALGLIERTSWNWAQADRDWAQDRHPDPTSATPRWSSLVLPSDTPSLQVFRGMSDQFGDSGTAGSFTVPADAFVHSQTGVELVLVAQLADGSDLPHWILFDARSGKFSFEPTAELTGEFRIKLTARDGQGREATTLFRFHVSDKANPLTGRTGLSQQLREAVQHKQGKRTALAY